jgi:tetratricopeptide (TPR) repeat protein
VPTATALQRAHALTDLERWPEAVQALQPALADPQAGAEPWCLLALCQLALDQTKDAERSARRAIAAQPQQEWGHRLLATALGQAGRLRTAIRACEEALRLEPDLGHGLYLMTTLQISRGRPRTAERLAARNLQANPHLALAWEGAAHAALARRKWSEAEQHAREGLRIDPQDADLALLLGRALNHQGRTKEAAEAFAAAARSDPTDHRPRRALGRLGVPILGGLGLILIKAAPFLFLRLIRLIVSLTPAQSAVILTVLFGGWYGVTELRHLRARRQLTPQLREIATRQRRQDARVWVLFAAVSAGVLAGWALARGDGISGVVLVAVLVAAVVLRLRLPEPPPLPPAPPGTEPLGWRRVLQSILIRLR